MCESRQSLPDCQFPLQPHCTHRQSAALQPGEQKARIAEAAKKTYVIPYSTKDRVSERSIERYLRLYRLGGYEALVPRQAKKPALNSRIPAVYLEKAAALKREHQDRAISTIITLLETANEVPQGVLKRSTVYDYFRRLGLDRKNDPGSQPWLPALYAQAPQCPLAGGCVPSSLSSRHPGQKREKSI